VTDADLEPAGAPTDGGTGALSWGQSRSSWGSSLGHDGRRFRARPRRHCGHASIYDSHKRRAARPPTASCFPSNGLGRPARQRRSGVTDRRDEERDRREREDAERRRKEHQRRSDELREAWRRNHPSRPEEGDEGRPKKGRM
jgi:hypothetical protein